MEIATWVHHKRQSQKSPSEGVIYKKKRTVGKVKKRHVRRGRGYLFGGRGR